MLDAILIMLDQKSAYDGLVVSLGITFSVDMSLNFVVAALLVVGAVGTLEIVVDSSAAFDEEGLDTEVVEVVVEEAAVVGLVVDVVDVVANVGKTAVPFLGDIVTSEQA